MENKCSLVLLLLCFASAHAFRTQNGSESWGYVEVRPKAHMFWWLYRSPNRVENGSTPWPTVLWLQGGPGASGVGIGNFQEIGPLDVNLNPRNSTWLNIADLLFVDNPVGTGYSYVEDSSLFVRSDVDAANDLTALLKNLYNNNETLQKSPLTIVAESYGGKFAVTAGLSIANAIKSGGLKLQFGGVALGDSWISPEDFVFSWGPLLLDVSRLDINGAEQSNSLAEQIKQQIANGKYEDATGTWTELENAIASSSNSVDFYNFMLDSKMDPLSTTITTTSTTSGLSQALHMKKYSMYLNSKAGTDGDIDSLMNGVIKDKLKIIPKDVSWGGQSDSVFENLAGDFMRPRIDEVDQLLSLGVNVTVYNGQVDLICATKGTEAWVQKLKWDGLKDFNKLMRTPVYCGSNKDGETKGFMKSYQNFHFYWILGAGHFVPVDQPCISLQMVAAITQSPAPTVAVTNAI
ncbi:putative carboxypeptidase C [Dioscorea sansibarensis]